MSARFGLADNFSLSLAKVPAAAGAYDALLDVFRRYRESRRRWRQLQRLLDLDDRLLADVGITRAEAIMAARRAGGDSR